MPQLEVVGFQLSEEVIRKQSASTVDPCLLQYKPSPALSLQEKQEKPDRHQDNVPYRLASIEGSLELKKGDGQ